MKKVNFWLKLVIFFCYNFKQQITVVVQYLSLLLIEKAQTTFTSVIVASLDVIYAYYYFTIMACKLLIGFVVLRVINLSQIR